MLLHPTSSAYCAFAWLRVAVFCLAKCGQQAANLHLILNLLCSVVGARFQDYRSL
jgi:hypothetical protein